MKTKQAAYDGYLDRLTNAWKDDEDEHGKREIVPDGGRVTVSMMALDSVQRQIADNAPNASDYSAADSRPSDSVRKQAWRDHFDAKRAEDADDSARGDYIKRTGDAWKNPPNLEAV